MPDDIPVDDIKELLDAVAEKVPNLIRELTATLYSEETAGNLGKAAGRFYQELVEAGIPAEEALEMTKSYIGSLQSMLDKVKHH